MGGRVVASGQLRAIRGLVTLIPIADTTSRKDAAISQTNIVLEAA
jgi:hypothetical protein